MEKSMVRYNVVDKNRKDTLFTFRDGDLVFFGISRCNVKAGDKFDKERGKLIAQNRALKAKALADSGKADFSTTGNLIENFNNVNIAYGSVPVAEVKSLLNYFRTFSTTIRL